MTRLGPRLGSALAFAACIAGALIPARAPAQLVDSVRVGVAEPRDARPPISPRRAFVKSLLVPGSGQIALERPIAAGIFAFVEVASLGMARRAALNLREAKSAPRDSVVLAYERDPTTGQPVIDPATGQFKPAAFRSTGLRERIKARRTHYEDWVALLLFNHLFAAADAYVAAHLWDFPEVTTGVAPNGARVVAVSVAW